MTNPLVKLKSKQIKNEIKKVNREIKNERPINIKRKR